MDETYVGGKERNKHGRKKLGRNWQQGKTVVAGAKDRTTNQVTARVVTGTDREELCGFVDGSTDPSATVYTDGPRPTGAVRTTRALPTAG
ncbi:MAG: transposase [Gemmatimonadota bacterium]|nr:transposase [Gemmatimonadota bacterium]